MVPASGRVTPHRMRISVLLPAPLPPTSPITSPAATVRSMSSLARVGPKTLVTPARRTTVSAAVGATTELEEERREDVAYMRPPTVDPAHPRRLAKPGAVRGAGGGSPPAAA